MANVSLTTHCNRACGYCFAGRLDTRQVMRPEDFGRVLDLLERSGCGQVRLLGGEPTLHPDFAAFVATATRRGFSVQVFSNGLMPDESLHALAGLPAEQCAVLLNILPPDGALEAEGERLDRTMRMLGPRANPGVNLYRPGLELTFALDLIGRYGLRRVLRLGLAHPKLGGGNTFLDPKFYSVVGAELFGLAQLARSREIALDLDCGFVPCMFAPEFYEEAQLDPSEIGTRCGPIPDILPDLTAIHCYALGQNHRLPISGVDNTTQLVDWQEQRHAPARRLGIYRDCLDCAMRAAGACRGGCLAAAMRRLQSSPAVSRAEVAPATAPHGSGRQPWLLPYIDQPAPFWADLAERCAGRLSGAYFPLPTARVGSGRPPQPDQHLPDFLRQGHVAKHVLINPVVLPGPVAELAPGLVDQLAELTEEYGLAGATVADLRLAERVRRRLPQLELTASVLMAVSRPEQAMLLNGIFDVLVAATRVLHDRPAWRDLRTAFGGRLRVLVNEACLPGCLYRRQHFYEMAMPNHAPDSPCQPLLDRQPWLRLTTGFILPQHLRHLDPLADEYKLAGRVTLADPSDYHRVCEAYLHRTALWPHEIGGGPASVLGWVLPPDWLFEHQLSCGLRCHRCDLCQRLARSGHGG